MVHWYIDTDNVVKIIGLRNVETLAYVNNATITGILYKLPSLHPDAGGVAVMRGTTATGIPIKGHGLSSGDTVRLESFVNYDGVHILDALTSVDEIVVPVAKVDETFVGDEHIYEAVVGTNAAPITFSYQTGSNGNYVGKIAYTAPLRQDVQYALCLKEVSGSEQVLAKVVGIAGYQGL